jgi:hypothetical protein
MNRLRQLALASSSDHDTDFYRSLFLPVIKEPFAKQSFRPNSALCSKFYPRNIMYMPAGKFFACLDFERKSKFCKRL